MYFKILTAARRLQESLSQQLFQLVCSDLGSNIGYPVVAGEEDVADESFEALQSKYEKHAQFKINI